MRSYTVLFKDKTEVTVNAESFGAARDKAIKQFRAEHGTGCVITRVIDNDRRGRDVLAMHNAFVKSVVVGLHG